MKAIVYYENGSPDVLKWEEIDKPVPSDDEVLIKVRAASANPLDWRLLRGGSMAMRMLSRRGPKMKCPGVDVAGEVQAVGKNVALLKPGEPVFGFCKGAFAEYACSPASKLAIKPDGITFEQAASIPVAGLTALQALRDKGSIRSGQRVLVNGAAGGVGTFAVQVAKWFGAEVTGVCSTKNVEMVRSIGADHAVDYTQEDFTQSARPYDIILDCIANHSLTELKRVLTSRGRCIVIGGKNLSNLFVLMAKGAISSLFGRQKFTFMIAKSSPEDLRTIAGLIANGKLTPVIEKRYSLRDAPEAIRYLEQGHARGKVVINLE